MKIISILGCGWLGLPLGRFLAEKEYKVKGSTTRSEKLSEISGAGIKPYLISFQPEINGDPADFFESDILLINLPPRNKDGVEDYHIRQLETIRKQAKDKVKHVLFISSTGVYPDNNSIVREEDADPTCSSRGGVSLLRAEQVFSNVPYFKTTVIRFGGLYGPDRHPGRFFAGKKGIAGGKNPVNMIHLDDCIGVIRTIFEQEIWGEVFNACSPVEKTRKEFYTEAAKELGLEKPEFKDEPSSFKKVSSEKLVRMTGYHFTN